MQIPDSYNPATGEWNDSLLGNFLWSNVNVGEAAPDVMTPLGWSILRNGFNSISIVPGYGMMGNICGRPYNNVNVVLTILRLTGRNARDYGNELGGGYDQFQEWIAESKLEMPPGAYPEMLINLLRVGWRQARALRKIDAFLAGNLSWCQQMQARLKAAKTGRELLGLWSGEIADWGKDGFMMVFSSAMQYTGQVGKLRRDLVEWAGPEDASALLSNVSRKADLLPSLGPLVGAWKVFRGEISREEFLEQYGHRGPNEGSILTPIPDEDFEWLDNELEAFARNPVDVEALLQEQQEKFEAAWQRFKTSQPSRAKSVKRRIERAAGAARLREAARSEFMRVGVVSRRCAQQAGRFTGLGEEIYFLTFEEIWDLLRGREPEGVRQIPVRIAAYERQKSFPLYPPVIRGEFDPIKWAADPERRQDYFESHAAEMAEIESHTRVITGTAGSAGVVVGIVRRIDDFYAGDRLQSGEILVTSQTNVGWTPLFPRAGAVVTDIGAPLSHAAIVARELGIPAVVGCRDATERLKTGDRVRVDGTQGTVEILDKR